VLVPIPLKWVISKLKYRSLESSCRKKRYFVQILENRFIYVMLDIIKWHTVSIQDARELECLLLSILQVCMCCCFSFFSLFFNLSLHALRYAWPVWLLLVWFERFRCDRNRASCVSIIQLSRSRNRLLNCLKFYFRRRKKQGRFFSLFHPAIKRVSSYP